MKTEIIKLKSNLPKVIGGSLHCPAVGFNLKTVDLYLIKDVNNISQEALGHEIWDIPEGYLTFCLIIK